MRTAIRLAGVKLSTDRKKVWRTSYYLSYAHGFLRLRPYRAVAAGAEVRPHGGPENSKSLALAANKMTVRLETASFSLGLQLPK